MGTRSITKVTQEDGKVQLVAMYRQYDGYPDGHGLELCEFLKNKKIINGIPIGEPTENLANGMGCLAAQMVAYFKTDVGGIYLDPGFSTHIDYSYEIYLSENNEIRLKMWSWWEDENSEPEFDGTVLEFMNKYSQANLY